MLLGISLTLRNRLVRTRMPGGVRGRGLAAPFYSIAPGMGVYLYSESLEWAGGRQPLAKDKGAELVGGL